jgi:hypothetical protein
VRIIDNIFFCGTFLTVLNSTVDTGVVKQQFKT